MWKCISGISKVVEEKKKEKPWKLLWSVEKIWEVRVKDQARVVQKVDNAIHRINNYPADSVVCFVNIYPLDSDLSGG